MYVIVLLILLLGQPITLANQTTINDIRIHNFKSKTRVVLDFSSNIGSYTIKSINNNTTSITIPNSELLDTINRSIQLSTSHKLNISQIDKDINLNINIANTQLSTYTVESPDRLIIDISGIINSSQAKNTTKSNNNVIYPGVEYKKYILKGPVIINVLDIDLNNHEIDLSPVTASNKNLFRKTSVNHMVNSNKALAGINASFFKPPTGLPLGTLIINDEFITGPIYNRVALVIDNNNKAYLDKVKFYGLFTLPDGTILPFNNINQPRLSLDGYMIYSDKWQAIVPKTLKNEQQIAVIDNLVTQKTTGAIRVPANGYVITGPNKDAFKNLKIGDHIEINISNLSKVSDIKHAIGGGPYLLKNGEVFIDSKNEKFSINGNARDPRTAVGITKENHLLLVTVDGRQNGSIGMSFYQLASFFKSLGAVHAMNFDGGSSTQMSIKGRIANRPTVKGGASISTGIIVKAKDNVTIANKYP